MTREEKLEAIYKEMANKEKTLGCKYLVYKNNEPDKIIEATEEGEGFTLYFGSNDYAMKPTEEDYYEYYSIKEIIGHPVMIGDVMYYIRKKYWNNHSWFHSDRSKLIDLRSKERESIEGQYDECIDFVYSLIQKD